ncbi:DUF6973 domain-containing protein [Lacrimispora sp.]|uniref:DUF6973 domain-containing protein n=1 Tax=Lacrimispora sp. TaxID=2719234 RepID=UPI002FDA7C0B
MKKIKKLVSIITTGVFVLSMNITAFAAPNNSGKGRISDMTISEVVTYLENSGGSIDPTFLDICQNIIKLKDDGMENSEILIQIENRPTTFSLYEQWGKLTNSEKGLVVLYPKEALAIQGNANKATNSTISVYGRNGNGDMTDAYRHGYWNALNARDVGKLVAELFATAHEDISEAELNKVTNGFTGRQHKSMDLHNNAVGRGVVNWNDLFTSDSTMSNRILEKITTNHMVILVK